MKTIRSLPLFICCLAPVLLSAQETRPLKVEDIFAFKNVGDPRISPDGKWVAYTVSAMDAKEDSSDTDIYMCPIEGGAAIQLTSSKKSESSPRWSPDGRYLAFLSAREGNNSQIWLLNRTGGEAVKVSDFKTSASSIVWSPDSRRLALVMSDPDPDRVEPEGEEAKSKTQKPLVIRRL
ncbi:MAG: S9 family peptidase, partial [Acidobacteria bacterium]|nr:S9 family peptidase [Acidobacteriota bacterium]